VPAESPTLGLTHLQFEALLTAARESPNPSDFALVVMLGLLGLRIFEATAADIADLGEEHGHRVLRVCGKGTKVVPPTSPGLNFGRRPALPVERTCAGIAQRYEDA
jgi:integrase